MQIAIDTEVCVCLRCANERHALLPKTRANEIFTLNLLGCLFAQRVATSVARIQMIIARHAPTATNRASLVAATRKLQRVN